MSDKTIFATPKIIPLPTASVSPGPMTEDEFQQRARAAAPAWKDIFTKMNAELEAERQEARGPNRHLKLVE
jgi:hypothetical protein